MNTSRRKRLRVALAAVLFGAAGAVPGSSAAAAQSLPEATAANSPAVIACAPGGGRWTACTVTVSQALGAGGSIVATLASGAGTVAFCSDGTPSDIPFCGVDGNTVTFFCPYGCVAGAQFFLGVLDAPATVSGANLAQQFTIAGG